MLDLVINSFRESADVKLAFVELYAERILEVGKIMAEAIKSGNKILLFGNGGSAADAQHIAAEIVGRFKKERRALPAIALPQTPPYLQLLETTMALKPSLKGK